MAAIQFSVMKTRVALNANNLQSNDPHYTYLGDLVNEAANRVILMAVGKDRKALNNFPELKRRRWSDITVNNQGYLTLPTSLLVLDSVKVTRVTTTYDPSRDTEYPVEETDYDTFALLNKASTTTGYPTMWAQSGQQLLLWPTPTTAKLTQVVLRGIRRESDLSGATDTLVMDPIWHPAVIDYATYLLFHQLGIDESADKWLVGCKDKLTETINLLGLGNQRNRMRLQIAGAPGVN